MLKDYFQLYRSRVTLTPITQPVKENKIPVLESDVHTLTLAEASPLTKDILTAHCLGDYRCMPFQLSLLPKADILFDFLLGGGYYGKFL